MLPAKIKSGRFGYNCLKSMKNSTFVPSGLSCPLAFKKLFQPVQIIERAIHEKHEKAAARHEGQEIEALSKVHTAHEG